MHVTWVITGRHGTGAARKHVEVIQVVARCSDHRMVAIPDQHEVAVDHLKVSSRTGGIIEALNAYPSGLLIR